MKRVFAVLILCSFLLCGCGEDLQIRVVDEITVTQEQTPGMLLYSDPYKMQRILNSLRQLGQRYRPDMDPGTIAGSAVCITLHFSDGSSHRYSLKADRYIQEEPYSWQQTDPRQLQRLYFLLKALPGD